MKVETPQEWARRVMQEIRSGQLNPPPVEEPAKDGAATERAIKLAKEIGREKAAAQRINREVLKHYMIGEEWKGER